MILILGIGNILIGDDGFGSAFAIRYKKELEALAPGKIRVIDLGAHVLEALDYLPGTRYLFFVDAVHLRNGEENKIYIIEKDNLLNQPKSKIVMSSHSDGIQEILNTAEWTEVMPQEVKLYGVLPHSFDQGMELSPTLESMLDPVKNELIKELKRIMLEDQELAVQN